MSAAHFRDGKTREMHCKGVAEWGHPSHPLRPRSGSGETHLRDPAEARLLPCRDMAMRLRVRVRGGMGGVPGAEERGRIGGAAARAGPGQVILSLGPLPGMASPFTLQQGTRDGARAWQARLWPQLAPGTRLKMTGRVSVQPEIISPTPCSPDGRPCGTEQRPRPRSHRHRQRLLTPGSTESSMLHARPLGP